MKKLSIDAKSQNRIPKVTIVTVTYNLIKAGREQTIRECIESVHRQSYTNIEHIIIDGNSDDGTLKLLDEYVSKGWIRIYSEPDSGIYDAMNKGLAKAGGKYISFLNSDDFYHSRNGVKKTVKALERRDADFAYSPCRFVDEENKTVGISFPSPETFFIRMPFSHQTLFVNTELMRKLNGFNTDYKSAGDYEFVIRLFLNGAYGIAVPSMFVSFREGGFSTAGNGVLSNNECIQAFSALYPQIDGTKTDYSRMFYHFDTLETFKNRIKKTVHPSVAERIEKNWRTEEPYGYSYRYVLHYHCVNRIRNDSLLKKAADLLHITENYAKRRIGSK